MRYQKQRGAVTLIGALFIIITLALMIQVLHRTAGSDVLDTATVSSSIEALFLAESGLEHAAGRLAAGPCDATLAGSFNLGSGSFTIENIGAAFNTDFSGSALPAGNCRVRVTGAGPVFSSQRVIEAIFQAQGNLLAGTNADFNDTFCILFFCFPTGWTPFWFSVDNSGGPDGSRAAVAQKTSNGGSVQTSASTSGLTPFTVTAPATLTLNFDYRVQGTGGGPNKARLDFGVWDGTTLHSAATLQSDTTSGFANASVSIPIGGSGTVTVTEFRFTIEATAGQPKTVWLDNLNLQGAGGGNVNLLQWREVVSN